jgi:hypothetical protein
VALPLVMGCGSHGSAPGPAPAIQLEPEALRNASYRVSLAPDGVRLSNGEYREPAAAGAAPGITVSLEDSLTAVGDLDGDRVVDAAVVLIASGGGSGSFRELAAVLNRGGTPYQAASAPLGDRVKVQSTAIHAGQIQVRMLSQGAGDPLCCPTVETIRAYTLHRTYTLRANTPRQGPQEPDSVRRGSATARRVP